MAVLVFFSVNLVPNVLVSPVISTLFSPDFSTCKLKSVPTLVVPIPSLPTFVILFVCASKLPPS